MRTEDARLIQSFVSHLLSNHSISCSMPLSERRRQLTTLPRYQSQFVKSVLAYRNSRMVSLGKGSLST